MKLLFLPEAVDDIDRLYNFLVPKNPVAAQKAMLAIDEGLAMLQENPFMGLQMENNPDYQELYVPFGKSAYVSAIPNSPGERYACRCPRLAWP